MDDHHTAALATILAYQTTLLHIIAKRTTPPNAADKRRSQFPISPFIVAGLLFALFATTGCVRTRVKVGTASLDRLSVLTKVEVPSITYDTNGSFSASVSSTPQTQLVDALIRALVSARPP